MSYVEAVILFILESVSKITSLSVFSCQFIFYYRFCDLMFGSISLC